MIRIVPGWLRRAFGKRKDPFYEAAMNIMDDIITFKHDDMDFVLEMTDIAIKAIGDNRDDIALQALYSIKLRAESVMGVKGKQND